LGLDPIILHEQTNAGRSILGKLEHNADVGFAVVLLTPDDVGAAKAEFTQPKPRARQNVIFELGFFIGKLGTDRVCALHKSSVELPSDYAGIAYVSMDDTGWQLNLARELKTAGFDVDMNRLFHN
jgi:predicted nucleotide-binding protein